MIRKKRQDFVDSLIFIGPILILYTTFFAVPFVMSFVYSLTDWDGLQKTYEFIGFKNYIDIFKTDESFINSVKFTFTFAFFGFVLVNGIGLLFALLVNIKFRVTNIVRTMLYLPNVISIIVVGFLWKFMYRSIIPEIGKALDIAFFQQYFLTTFDGMVFVVLVPAIWQSVGFAMLIYLAGLQGIPNDLKEVMKLDGANAVQRFFHLTVPFLIPSFVALAFLTTTAFLKVFDIVVSLTAGGPGKASETIAMNIYREGLLALKYGAGSAKAISFAVVILIIAIIQLVYLKSKEIET